METLIPNCLFCQEISSALWQSKNFYILLDIAPIIEGHALICSRGHYASTADLPESMAIELQVLCERLRVIYTQTYGSFTLFEHGRTGHCLHRTPEEKACAHLHVHTLPLGEDITSQIELSQRVPWINWAEVRDLGGNVDGYVVVETAQSGRNFYPVSRALRPHYLRTRAATLVGDMNLGDWEQLVRSNTHSALLARAKNKLGVAVFRGL